MPGRFSRAPGRAVVRRRPPCCRQARPERRQRTVARSCWSCATSSEHPARSVDAATPICDAPGFVWTSHAAGRVCSLRSNDREEPRKSMVEIAGLSHAEEVPDALLALLPERECLLDGSLTGLCEQDGPGARVRRIPGDPEEAGLLQRQQVPRESGPIHPQDLRHLAHAGTGLAESGDGDEHGQLRDVQAGAAQVLVIEPGHGAGRLPHAHAGALPGDFPRGILEIGLHAGACIYTELPRRARQARNWQRKVYIHVNLAGNQPAEYTLANSAVIARVSFCTLRCEYRFRRGPSSQSEASPCTSDQLESTSRSRSMARARFARCSAVTDSTSTS